MSTEKTSSTIAPSTQSGRHISPSPHGLRQRPLGRSAAFADGYAQLNRRRSSFLSETLSETRKSLRSSTDDIFLPRARGEKDFQDQDDASHWHSLPLALALFPAVGGVFFKNGSAFVTDVTLLALAAIFMNWALRSPWDWYRAAQSSIILEPISPSAISPIEEHEEFDESSTNPALPETTSPTKASPRPSLRLPQMQNVDAASAQRELRLHEMMALFGCFACPLLAAWLLHAIRSQLTRPSEGLVSNYNLTIFLLVAEVRPLAHLIKLIQRRTFFLQRRVNADVLSETRQADTQQVLDITHRLEALEVHVADRIASSGTQDSESGEALAAKASILATGEVKKLIQPELDALNRAMRRYEKRTAISSVQIEARLQDLEARLQDVVALAAAVQRNADRQSTNYASTLLNWVSAFIVVPMQYLMFLSSLPAMLFSSIIAVPNRYMTKPTKSPPVKEHRNLRKGLFGKTIEHEKRSKQT
ncbi:uncharacterized protein A1O9_02735 [Exophiala aquamarina CBS 119918]|uniref:Uncharacterized protein n=1 Tax=Exophiala aquamarina CBS 119918 TaxID=1182545 RepID=A0A072PZU5_9EURO|nr:uncharacterized protein A1O9_02735 [Exophiala aquamarina CBS 119918]KEF61170.1 hypothetical protein A1O9_02735 [Exophiala aquamarina CBS 119918]